MKHDDTLKLKKGDKLYKANVTHCDKRVFNESIQEIQFYKLATNEEYVWVIGPDNIDRLTLLVYLFATREEADAFNKQLVEEYITKEEFSIADRQRRLEVKKNYLEVKKNYLLNRPTLPPQ